MLVIISDLHLKDGTTGTSITADAFRVFAERLRSLAYRASWRQDGKYRPIESLDLLLLGDIFDHILSTRWLEQEAGQPGYARPWHDPSDPAFLAKIEAINRGTLQHNAEALQILKRISQGLVITLPPATEKGHPDHNAGERLPVPVRIHQMVGNHDWFLHLPGPAYDSMRQEIIETIGLANSPAPFPHDASESDTLMQLFRDHHVFGRHGDIFDSMNYNAEAGRDVATIGDALAIELFNRFPAAVHERLGSDLPQAFTDGLKELTNVRPALVTPLWVSNLIRNYAQTPELGNQVKRIWDDLGEQFLDLDFVRSQDKAFKFDTVDALQGILLFSRALPFDTINKMMTWMTEKFWGGKFSFAEHALLEQAFKERWAQYIVYGHTHIHEVVPLDSTYLGDRVLDQTYVNSGTWHSYHDLTLRDPHQHKFIGMHVMTYLAFFKGDERDGRPFESWAGTLSGHDKPI